MMPSYRRDSGVDSESYGVKVMHSDPELLREGIKILYELLAHDAEQ